MLNENAETKSRLIAKLVWQLVKTDGPFETLAELTDVLKSRLARLRIKWTPTEISDAYALIETNTPLVALLRAQPVEPAEPAPTVSQADALAALRQIRQRLNLPPLATTPKRVPGVRQLTDHEIRERVFALDRRRALAQVQQQILDTAEHVAQLEAAIEHTPEDR